MTPIASISDQQFLLKNWIICLKKKPLVYKTSSRWRIDNFHFCDVKKIESWDREVAWVDFSALNRPKNGESDKIWLWHCLWPEGVSDWIPLSLPAHPLGKAISSLPLSFPPPLFWLILLIRNSVIKTSAKPPLRLPSTRAAFSPFFIAQSLKFHPDLKSKEYFG